MHDLEWCLVCPDEIAEGEPSIRFNDNDDILNDTLTGLGNWMFPQRLERLIQKYVANLQDDHAHIKDAKAVWQALTEEAS